ncbi:MAG TPA: type II secretion system protein GspL [Moraxellaceae bacterium]|nr:type II secretion system protein GspL [Moraxellaceae bacterium]
MNLLYLHLPDPAGPARAWWHSEAGLADLGTGEPAQFAQQHPGSPCVVFLPSAQCLFTTVAVTARQLRQAGASLAWLVEDQAGEDAESLHVVAGTTEGDSTPLFAMSRALLQDWLERLRSAGLHLLAVVPDLFLLPRDDSDWQLLPQGERVYLRTGASTGAVLEADATELLLDAALLERGAAPPPVISLSAGAPEAWTRVEAWADAHPGVSCRLSEGLTPAAGIAAVADWSRHPANLLQGEFAARANLAVPASLRWAAVFLAAAFALQLLSEWLHYGFYRYQASKVAAQVVGRYRDLYPGERLPAQPAAAFQDVQKRLRGKRNEDQGGADVLPALTRVAQALQGSGLSTQRVDILGGVLTLDVDARSLGELDGFKQKLDGAGFSTEIVSANNQGGVIRGRLRVEGGA